MDTNQNNNQNPVPVDPQQQSVSQPVASQVDSSQQVTQVQMPPTPQTVTPGGKEVAPVVVQGEPLEYLQPAAHESAPSVPEAVREAGVDVTPQQEQVQLSSEDQQVG